MASMDDIDTVWWRRCLDRHASAQVPAYAVLAEALARGCAAGVAAIGLTGPQGAGKSTLVEYLVQALWPWTTTIWGMPHGPRWPPADIRCLPRVAFPAPTKCRACTMICAPWPRVAHV